MKSMTLTELVNFVKSGYIPTSQDDRNDVADILGHQAVTDLVLLLYHEETSNKAYNLFDAIMGKQELNDLCQKAHDLKAAIENRAERLVEISRYQSYIEKAQKEVNKADDMLSYYGIVL